MKHALHNFKKHLRSRIFLNSLKIFNDEYEGRRRNFVRLNINTDTDIDIQLFDEKIKNIGFPGDEGVLSVW